MQHSSQAFEKAKNILDQLGFEIISKDTERPWGGFFVINESQAPAFAAHFFPEENFETLKITEKLSPKFLIVAPHKRLSWQYHLRRAEIWRCIDGQVAVASSHTDVEENKFTLVVNDKIKLQQGQRHRLMGTKDWGIVAEIWQHTDAANPSNEDDIIRLKDDFGR